MPTKVALVIHSLAGGGAERVVSQLANHLIERGTETAVITLDSAANDVYTLHPDVRRIGLDQMRDSTSLWQAIYGNVRRVRSLRRALQEFGAPVTISFTDKMNIVALIACRGSNSVTICERTDPRHQPIGRIWSSLRRWFYPKCRSLVVQTEGVRDWARRLVPSRPIHVIANTAPQIATSARSQTPPTTLEANPHRIVALGRLAREKGFDLLLSAFAQIAAKHPNWKLRLHGEGPERGALQRQCRQLALQDRVEMPGWTAEPERELSRADLFVLPSRYEGFPNALLEAMAAGAACISFDCESGPAEIIRNGVDGVLVAPGDVNQLAETMSRLMTSPSARQELGHAARAVTDRFNADLIFRQWRAVIEGATEQETDALAACPD